MADPINILLISGSTRGRSTNTALLRTAELIAPAGVQATLFTRMTDLPHFNPDDDQPPLHPAVADLRRAIASVQAVLFSTPEYAGALPGSFKNLLDWTVGGGEIYRKPVAWINASWSPTGAADAHALLGLRPRPRRAPRTEATPLRPRLGLGADRGPGRDLLRHQAVSHHA